MSSGAAVTPLKVKYRDLKKLEARRSYRGFLERYHPESGYIVSFRQACLTWESALV